MEKEKHLGLRIDAETHKKLKSLAEFEGRSINGEVLYLIRQAIIEFENKHLQEAVLQVKKRYGKNAIMRGSNLLECSTYRERNNQVGGHRA